MQRAATVSTVREVSRTKVAADGGITYYFTVDHGSGRRAYRIHEDRYECQDNKTGVVFRIATWAAHGWTDVLDYRPEEHPDGPETAIEVAKAVHTLLS